MLKLLLKILVGALLLVGIAVGVFYFMRYERTRIKTTTVKINDTVFTVEIADTEAKRELGLGGHNSLADNEGMLFTFPSRGFHSFWMKGMMFPLDIIWIQDGIVVDVVKDAPVPEDYSDMSVFTPANPADMVLELNAGIADKYNIKIGDEVVSGLSK